MSGDVQIRRARARDAVELKSIRQQSLLNAPDAYGSTYAESLVFDDDHWIRIAVEQVHYLAFDGERAIGTAAGGPYAPKPDARWLYGMYVDPSFRGTDVARDLVSLVANWAREEGYRTLGLHVTSTMARARAFYEKVGFQLTGESEPMRRDHALRLLLMATDLQANDLI